MGLKGFNLTVWHGMYAPKGTPPAVLKQLNEAMKAALKDPEFLKRQEALGAVVVTDKRTDPEGHKAFVTAEIAKLKPAIEAAGKFAD
jgi:tripartite-type tricarboxylate transporter receptor subunit TctC